MAELSGSRGGIQKYEVDERPCDHVRTSLRGAGALAQQVLLRTVIEKAFTFLTVGIPNVQLTTFSSGGKLEMSSDVWRDWISTQLSRRPHSVLLAENFELEPSSPLLGRKPGFLLADGGVLFLAVRQKSIDRVITAMSRYPSILVITRDEDNRLRAGVRLNSLQLAQLATAAAYALVGAYDEESFVCVRCRPREKPL